MSTKDLMLRELGEDRLLLPAMVNAGLAANDRVKYYLSLLQAAVRHAEEPSGDPPNFRRERQAAGVTDATLDQVAAEVERLPDGRYRLPRAAEIERLALEGVEEMLAPVLSASIPGVSPSDFLFRLENLRTRLGAPAGEAFSRDRLEFLTSGLRHHGDSLHLLVMDLHAALNQLQASIATETVDGARTYGLTEWGRERVRAFMMGLNRTASLRFDHPGLGTTATMVGDQLVLQNDIGTTDVHVLVVHVEGLEATVTYSDLHPERLVFFQEQLAPFAVRWSEAASGTAAGADAGGAYQLASGTFAAADLAELDRYLAHLGSRLVFLIDWNKARKRLRDFVGNRRAIAVLASVARNDQGHMAFLKLGGSRLIYDVLEATRLPLRPGERLDEVLGGDASERFLCAALALCSEALRKDRSEFLLRDELRVELARHVASAQGSALTLVQKQATLIVELAGGARDTLGRLRVGDREFAARNAARSRAWEHAADALVNEARQLSLRWHEVSFVQELLVATDDVADDLEEAAFLMALPVEVEADQEVFASLGVLAACVVRGAEEFARAVSAAGAIPQGGREDYADFLDATDGVLAAEHQADEAHRATKAALLVRALDFRAIQLFGEIAKRIEAAADGLMRSALSLRAHVLARLGAP